MAGWIHRHLNNEADNYRFTHGLEVVTRALLACDTRSRIVNTIFVYRRIEGSLPRRRANDNETGFESGYTILRHGNHEGLVQRR